jgi:YfiH family protein
MKKSKTSCEDKPSGEDKPPDEDKQGCLLPTPNILISQGFSSSCLVHGTFNRHGGVSPPPWDSNNVSFGLGDSSENVRANRRQIKKALGFKRLVSAKQVHDSRVYTVDTIPTDDMEIDGFDALITNVPGMGLMIQQADCQAVFLFDPEKKAIGIAHVGWRGSVADIISKTVFAMSRVFSTEPVDVKAAISPSLGPCCAEFVNFRSELPDALHGYEVRPNYFDFWAISHDQLCSTGIRPENIHIAAICTRCNQDFFSYRRDRDTGRFTSVIGIRER